MKEFKLRFCSEVPDATSEAVSAWLDDALKTGASLATDPGGGEAFCNLSLDEEKVAELANRHGCKSNVALRRLIASKVSLVAVESPKRKNVGTIAAELLPGKVLPKRLEYKEADLLPLVRDLDSGMMLLYRQIYGLPELTLARTPEADRELASSMAEAVNRRSHEWLLANADLVKLTFSFVRWFWRKRMNWKCRSARQRKRCERKRTKGELLFLVLPRLE